MDTLSKSKQKEEPVQIRQMLLRDIPEVMRIANQAFLEMGRKPSRFGSTILRRLRELPDLQLVAVKDGEVAGFLVGWIDSEGEARVNWIATHPSFQGKGVGRTLLSDYERRVKAKGFKKVLAGTPYARVFYERCGYTCISVTYRLVKELVGVSITGCDTFETRRLDLKDLPDVIDSFGGDFSRSFPESFFQTYEREPEKAMCTLKEGKIKGLVVGKTNEWTSELVEVVSLHAADDETLLCLLRNLELECSKRGVRWLGISTEDRSRLEMLEGKGWKRAAMPMYWTRYLMAKNLQPVEHV